MNQVEINSTISGTEVKLNGMVLHDVRSFTYTEDADGLPVLVIELTGHCQMDVDRAAVQLAVHQ